MKRLLALSALASVLPAVSPAAVPTGPGPYKWADYFSSTSVDARPSELTADQTWVVEGAQQAKPFWPGQMTVNDYWQIWTGDSVTAVSGSGFRVMKGNVVFENAVISQTTENYIGYVGPAKLVLRNGGSLLATADNIRIGRSYSNGTAGTATVYMEEPSSLGIAGNAIYAGNSLPGALWMEGGLVTLTNGTLYVGNTAAAEGYLRMNGGTLSLRSENADSLTVGSSSAYASVHISGGEVQSKRTAYASETYVTVGKTGSLAAEVYMDGGKVNLPNDRFVLGYSSTAGARATMTLDGTADFRVGLFVPGRSDAAILPILNLNGGRFYSVNGFANYGKASPIRQINFDGGTIGCKVNLSTTGATVYPKGGTIDLASGSHSVLLNPRVATGCGVTEIRLADPGSGYVTAPQVTISGGSGSGATGYAVLARDRTIEKVVVTCRGEGYAADDVLTVAFASATGSGAAATAVLGENTPGALRKTGPGVWQQAADSAFDGDLVVEEGEVAVDGAAFSNLRRLYVRNDAAISAGRSLDESSVRESAVNRIDAKDALAYVKAYGDSGSAKLTVGEFHTENGLLLVPKTNALALALTDASRTAASSSESPVVNGMVYGNGDSSAYRSPSVFERGADGALSVVTPTSVIGPDANFMPDASNSSDSAPEVTALNSVILPLSPDVSYYVKSAAPVEIKSGMIVCRRPQVGMIRFSVTGGGALTTRAAGGMFYYQDTYEKPKRSANTDDSEIDGRSANRRLVGPFTDPDATTAMSLTVAGERTQRPELGAVAWLITDNYYSGGLNLVNGGVFISTEAALGANGSPVRAAGYCSVAAYNKAFDLSANHPITIAADGALLLSPSLKTGNEVASALAGEGDLLTSDIAHPGYVVAYTGDHGAFSGDYYVQGHARIAPATFSPAAGLCLADGTDGVGVIETSGALTRAPGTGKGEICWRRHACYSSDYGLRGGFAAKDGDLTVNLGGDGRQLAVGSDYLPAQTVVQLQSQYADGALTLANGFELDGRTQQVSVWPGKTAALTGEISDRAGKGRLAVTGNLAFSGTLAATSANLAAGQPLLAVDGALDMAGATVALAASGEELQAYRETGVTLATATGGARGAPTLEPAELQSRWRIRVSKGEVALMPRTGHAILIR